MVLQSAIELPTIEQLFGGNSHLTRTLHKLKISSVAVLMELAPSEIRCLGGIAGGSMKSIRQALEAHKLPQRDVSGHMDEFVIDAFGGALGMPVSALSITNVDSTAVRHYQLAPLDTIEVLEELCPTMSLAQLMQHTTDELCTLLTDHLKSAPPNRAVLEWEVHEINRRLDFFGSWYELGATKLHAHN